MLNWLRGSSNAAAETVLVSVLGTGIRETVGGTTKSCCHSTAQEFLVTETLSSGEVTWSIFNFYPGKEACASTGEFTWRQSAGVSCCRRRRPFLTGNRDESLRSSRGEHSESLFDQRHRFPRALPAQEKNPPWKQMQTYSNKKRYHLRELSKPSGIRPGSLKQQGHASCSYRPGALLLAERHRESRTKAERT